MRVLTITDLFIGLGLFAIGSFIACSRNPLWVYALSLIVGAAVGVLGGRLRLGLATGVAIDMAFIATALIATARH